MSTKETENLNRSTMSKKFESVVNTLPRKKMSTRGDCTVTFHQIMKDLTTILLKLF